MSLRSPGDRFQDRFASPDPWLPRLALGVLAVACAGCSATRNTGPEPLVPPRWTLDDPCRVRAKARRDGPTVVVEVTDLTGPLLVESRATATGGQLGFTFSELSLPTFRVEPDPGVTAVVLTVPGQCDHHPVQIFVRLDLSRDFGDGQPVPLTVEDGGSPPRP